MSEQCNHLIEMIDVDLESEIKIFQCIKCYKEMSMQPPYTEHTSDFNFKPRIVKCDYCLYSIVTALPGPRCSICKQSMITVVK